MRRTLSAVAAAVLVLLVLPAPAALAHADYRDSDPGDGQTVSSAPSSVQAEFTEPPTSGSTLYVYDPCGQRVDSGNYSYQGFPLNSITVGMASDKAGRFTVQWTVSSAADGHTTRGVFSFTASSGEPCPGAAGSSGGSGEGSGGNRSAGNGGGDGGSGSAPAASAGGSGGSETAAGDADQKTQGKAKNRGSKSRSKTKKGDVERLDEEALGDTGDAVALTQAADPFPAPEEELPLDWLIVGLSISALIGAAGGRVYASIVGPKR